ncbi:uncharacterized protein CCOS01_02030 [Colletotrichum costaricense]|uniref:sphingolipid C(9)-methyltransferase n=1 Tax=Colletotrichum costaricense TaxID=1209916 RepID=A0AAJ0E6Q7_9PEZI|nr:uncharacterized protein CCOS01_02030 [Colletotrichum costaricense]KAK1536710.1 hypothetical protein CCOS01_02030 [Colletotrichum costaricense]
MAKYVYPDAVPYASLASLINQLETAGFRANSVKNIGRSYSETVRKWYGNFVRNREALMAMYGPKIYRTFEFFLAYLVIIFGQGSVNTYQIVVTKNPSPVDRTKSEPVVEESSWDLCDTSTNSFNGECQEFRRKEGNQDKTLWGCREKGLPWDPLVYLYTASTNLLPPAPATTTSSSSSSADTRITSVPGSSSTVSDDTSTPSVPSSPTLSTASSTSAPTPEPSNGGGGGAAPSSGNQTGAIVGGVLGSVTILAIAGCVVTWLVVRRRRASSVRGESRGGGHVLPSPSHELAGDQPCVSPINQKEGEQWNYQPMSPTSPASSSAQHRDVFQAPANDSIGSAMKPAELG